MKTQLIDLRAEGSYAKELDVTFSFKPFIDFLQKLMADEQTVKKEFYTTVLQHFLEASATTQQIGMDQIPAHKELLDLVYAVLEPVTINRKEQLWAISMPAMPAIVYGTPAFYDLLQLDDETSFTRHYEEHTLQIKAENRDIDFIYALIFEKIYNFRYSGSKEMIKPYYDKEAGLLRYFRINLDTRFIKVYEKEPIDKAALKNRLQQVKDPSDLEKLAEIVPLSRFRVEGFSLVTLADVTVQHATEDIKDLMINSQPGGDMEQNFNKVQLALKTLVGDQHVNFGVLPVLKINHKMVFDANSCRQSVFMDALNKHGLIDASYNSPEIQKFFREPCMYVLKDITAIDEKKKGYLQLLQQEGIVSYALLPLYFNTKVVGILEIYSKEEGRINEETIGRLKPVTALLAQLLQHYVEQFESSITHVIKDKFTSIQQAVEWKFNEVAWNYVQRQHTDDTVKNDIEDISFEKVFPLYGAIDIRNSTQLRNEAWQQDLVQQFTLVKEVLQELKEQSGFSLLDEKIYLTGQWLDLLASSPDFIQDARIANFLDTDIHFFLHNFCNGQPAWQAIADRYFQAIDEHTGAAYANRRKLEQSMGSVINKVNREVEKMNETIQKAYPCYFEKFRTDGVEYDIYIGQSITPDKPFSEIYLNNLRLLQLTTMASIAKKTHALLTTLAYPVDTTQLIFIHSNPIEIRFRKDEKRFDVEGTYNIKYQIVKKRIDKVHIKDTNERLTMPGKIAFVYFDDKVVSEYVSYINYLQQQQVLCSDLEFLELETLQGVVGLKALRVGVKFDEA